MRAVNVSATATALLGRVAVRRTPVTCNPARLAVQIHPSTMLIIVFVKQSPQWSEKL